MNKTKFLTLLRKKLDGMPIKEQNELLEDYETHYDFGQQQGKTEEEISSELGDPLELAVEAMAEYNRSFSGKSNHSSFRSGNIVAAIGLFMLNFILAIVPLGIAIWTAWFSFLLAGAAFIIAPLLAFADFIFNSYFSGGKLFASIVLSGIGIFLTFGIVYIGKKLKAITLSYYNWNMRVLKGRK